MSACVCVSSLVLHYLMNMLNLGSHGPELEQCGISGREEAGTAASQPSKVQHTVHIDSKISQVPICLLQKYFSCGQSGREALWLSSVMNRLGWL